MKKLNPEFKQIVKDRLLEEWHGAVRDIWKMVLKEKTIELHESEVVIQDG